MLLYLHSPNTSSWRGAQLKHRDNFTFTFTLTKTLWHSLLHFLPQERVLLRICYRSLRNGHTLFGKFSTMFLRLGVEKWPIDV
jgi:hypothetical protein